VSVCVGAQTAREAQRNVALLRTPVPAALWSELKATGLVRSDAPTPQPA
jgi:D-threo-aldose 1-dehydrogenase